MKIEILKDFEDKKVGSQFKVELKYIQPEKMVKRAMDCIDKTLDLIMKERIRLQELSESGVEYVSSFNNEMIQKATDSILSAMKRNEIAYYQFEDGNYILAGLEDMYFKVL